MNVKKKAQELADALALSSEFQRLKEARAAVEDHEAAKIMLRDFQEKQAELQKQQMEGKPASEKQTEELRKLYEILSINPYIRELFEAEFAFGGLMMDVQQTITQGLGLDSSDDEEEETTETEPGLETPTKKLWTPGN